MGSLKTTECDLQFLAGQMEKVPQTEAQKAYLEIRIL